MRRIYCCVGLLGWVVVGAWGQVEEPAFDAGPDVGHTAEAVVGFQLAGLKASEAGEVSPGMEQAYRFASPGNRELTGPVERFAGLFGAAPFDGLVGHARAVVLGRRVLEGAGEDDAQATAVEVLVRVTPGGAGAEAVYFVWVLTRQTEGEHAGCWMTDGVVPVERPAGGTA